MPLSCLSAGKSSIFLFLQGIPACCVYSLTGSQHRLTSLHTGVTEAGITTHSPSHTQLPSKWDQLLFKLSTAIRTTNMDTCEYVCCFSIRHGNLPFPPTHVMPSSGKFWYFPEDRLSAYTFYLLCMTEPHQSHVSFSLKMLLLLLHP